MIILGLNCFHGDASAALFRDGELIAAVEEERFNRFKHSGGFPSNAVRWCVNKAKIDPREIDYVMPAKITNNENPSEIRDAQTGNILRSG